MRSLWWTISAASLLFGVLFFLAPNVVVKVNKSLTKTLAELDHGIMRSRYMFGLLLLVVGLLSFLLGLS